MARTDLLQGTLDLLILRTFALGPRHGWAIAKRIQELSRDALRVNQGSLYPALYRLEDQDWSADGGVSSEVRRAKFYRLTAAGKRQLAEEKEQWRLFTVAVGHVLQGA